MLKLIFLEHLIFFIFLFLFIFFIVTHKKEIKPNTNYKLSIHNLSVTRLFIPQYLYKTNLIKINDQSTN